MMLSMPPDKENKISVVKRPHCRVNDHNKIVATPILFAQQPSSVNNIKLQRLLKHENNNKVVLKKNNINKNTDLRQYRIHNRPHGPQQLTNEHISKAILASACADAVVKLRTKKSDRGNVVLKRYSNPVAGECTTPRWYSDCSANLGRPSKPNNAFPQSPSRNKKLTNAFLDHSTSISDHDKHGHSNNIIRNLLSIRATRKQVNTSEDATPYLRRRSQSFVITRPSDNNKVFVKVDSNAVDKTTNNKCWNPRSSSLRHSNNHRHHHAREDIRDDPAATHSDTDLGKVATRGLVLNADGSVGSASSDHGLSIGRVELWESSFEKLIEDPAGLHTFAEFLKKEYSDENIYFWTACERYKQVSDSEERKKVAQQIFMRHLASGAQEAVNVDSQARQIAEENLHNPDEQLFSAAQKQIFNLMKQDSYFRFLKSDLYKDCKSRDQNLPYPGDDTLDPDLRITNDDPFKLKKSKSDADERRRKSLLPWHRKDRSKSKDRGEADYRRRKNKLGHRNTSDSSSMKSDVSGSRTSINSSDFAMGRRAASKESLASGDVASLTGAEGLSWCRVYLPDSSNSVLALRSGETVQQLLQRLLEKRGIHFPAFNVYNIKNDKLVDLNKEGIILDKQEVRVEQQVLFRLDLPNRKIACVKAKTNKTVGEVLKPILQKYGYKLDLMTVHKMGEATGINMKASAKEMNGQIFSVQTKEELKEYMDPTTFRKRSTTLDEITNNVFEDVLKGKVQGGFDDLGVFDIDAQSSKTDHSTSDQSSSLLEGLSRRNSLTVEKESKSRKTGGSRSSTHDNTSLRGSMPPSDINKLANSKHRTPNLPNATSSANQENDELYEGLKRAQRSRLDDQRGTEINFELPDFLKCDQSKENGSHHHLAEHLLAQLNSSFDGVLPSHQEAQSYFSLAHPEVWGSVEDRTDDPLIAGGSLDNTLLAPDLDLDDLDDTLRAPHPVSESSSPTSLLAEGGVDFNTQVLDPASVTPSSLTQSASRHPLASPFITPPPPLPPKPKVGVQRGPPPRPPSRQLHILNPPTTTYSTSEDGTLHLLDPSLHITRQCHDAFNISFV